MSAGSTRLMPVALILVYCVVALGPATAFAQAKNQTAKNQTYVWFSEVVTSDQKAKTITVKAPYREHINRYIAEFKPGDKVMVTWGTPRPGETEAITYIGRYEASPDGHYGYVLPVEFVSADTTERKLTFTMPVPSKALNAMRAVPSGGRIRVTTPFDQPRETAAILAIEPSE
jgi:hypothetical protein